MAGIGILGGVAIASNFPQNINSIFSSKGNNYLAAYGQKAGRERNSIDETILGY
jgi:hypothetical protein